MAMIDTTTTIPELWSSKIVEEYKNTLTMYPFGRPPRDAATQALRDAALGYPEFPDDSYTLQQLYDIYKENKHHDATDALQYALNTKFVESTGLSNVRTTSAAVYTGNGS